MKLPISERDAFAANHKFTIDAKIRDPEQVIYYDKDGTPRTVTSYVWNYKSTRDFDEHKRELLTFIDDCIEYRMTFGEVADLIGVSKQYVHRLWKYGLNSFQSSRAQRAKVRVHERDKRICQICHRKPKSIHIHHIGSHRRHTASNLISLCAGCHKKVEVLKVKFAKSGKRIADFSYAQELVDGSKRAA